MCFVGSSDVELWGMTPAERSMRIFTRNGVTNVISETDLGTATSPVIVMRADAVIDVPLIPVLIGEPGLVLMGDGLGHEKPLAVHAGPGQAAAAAEVLTHGNDRMSAELPFQARRPDQLGATYWQALRKREVPYALIVSDTNKQDVEWRTFLGTYKGATDLVTKHLWPLPAFHVTRLIAPTWITPNIVTAVSAVFVLTTMYFFIEAQWTLGLISAWLMTFLDTVDGKLARVTLTSSKWGNIFDHGIDLIHPPFWYGAWALGLAHTQYPISEQTFAWIMGLILAGYIIQRLMEGIAIKSFGLEIHIWRRIDTLFRQITARRNPNMVILTLSALIGRPDIGIFAVTAWTVICLVLHGVQLVQAASAKRRFGNLTSWMSQPVENR